MATSVVAIRTFSVDAVINRFVVCAVVTVAVDAADAEAVAVAVANKFVVAYVLLLGMSWADIRIISTNELINMESKK